jgi:hypothetical protein
MVIIATTCRYIQQMMAHYLTLRFTFTITTRDTLSLKLKNSGNVSVKITKHSNKKMPHMNI